MSLGHVPGDYVALLRTRSNFGGGWLRALWGEPFPSLGVGEPWVQPPERGPAAFFGPWQQKTEPCSQIPDPFVGPEREASRSTGLTQGVRFVLHCVVHLPGHPGHCLAHPLLHAGAQSHRGRASDRGICGRREKPAAPASRERDVKNNHRISIPRGGREAVLGLARPSGYEIPNFPGWYVWDRGIHPLSWYWVWEYEPFPTGLGLVWPSGHRIPGRCCGVWGCVPFPGHGVALGVWDSQVFGLSIWQVSLPLLTCISPPPFLVTLTSSAQPKQFGRGSPGRQQDPAEARRPPPRALPLPKNPLPTPGVEPGPPG